MTNKQKLADYWKKSISGQLKKKKVLGRPEYGKVYQLTGGSNTKCIMNGNTWSESEV